jgi:NADH-ubiquinone oxidoreductase chain 4
MILFLLLCTPIAGVFILLCKDSFSASTKNEINQNNNYYNEKVIALFVTTLNFLFSLFLIFFFDFSSNQFQFVIESISVYEYNLYLGIDGISIYFVLLTTIIMPIAILSN